MKAITLFPIFIGLILFSSCLNPSQEQTKGKPSTRLNLNEPAFFLTLFPHSIEDAVSSHVIFQIYEGLVKYDTRDLSVIPAIAQRWDIDSNGTVYQFYLKNNVLFHDDICFSGGKGRKVTASDFIYSFELLCTYNEHNKNFFGTLDKIKGAKEYYEASKEGKPNIGIEGIKALNDSTLQLIIEDPNPLFIYFLANPAAVVLPKEAISQYGYSCHIGSGPFQLKEIPKKNEPLYLIKNDKYHKKDKKGIQLPYIDSVKISFVSNIQKELDFFKKGELDVVMDLSIDHVNDFMEEHIQEFESNPPRYILRQPEEKNSDKYILMRSYINSFFTNNMSYIDLSIIYIEEPKPQKKENEPTGDNKSSN